MKRIAVATIFISLILLAKSASACLHEQFPNFSNLKKADAVFVGKLTKYDVLRGKLTFDILRTYKGVEQKTIEVVWPDVRYGRAKDIAEFNKWRWDSGRYKSFNYTYDNKNTEMLVVVKKPLPRGINENGDREQVPPVPEETAALWDYPWVLTMSCSKPFMFSIEEINEDKKLKADLSKYIDLEE